MKGIDGGGMMKVGMRYQGYGHPLKLGHLVTGIQSHIL